MSLSLKEPHGALWTTDHSHSGVREKLAQGKITGDWLVCPPGETARAVPVREFLARPTMFDPAPKRAVPPPLPSANIAGPAVPLIPFDRRHDLDALRATAMLLGIGLHGALAYTSVPFWPVYDDRNHGFFDVFFSSVHGFRMPLFFMISGFFTAMLWRKRGLPYLTRHRAKRILLPMILFLVTIIPAMTGIFIGIGAIEGARNKGPQEQRESQESATLWIAAKNNDIDALNTHLQGDVDIDARDPQHQIPALNWAALNGSTEAAKRLLEAGANVNVLSGDRSTPLSHAAFTGRADIVALFLEHEAKVNIVNTHRSTALDNTYADWGIVQWVAGALNLQVDRERMEAGRETVRELLSENGGKHRTDLNQDQLAESGARGDREREGIAGAYLSITEWEGFHVFEPFAHLWFLWFLLILFVPFAIYTVLARAVNWTGPPTWLFLSPVVLLWLVPLTIVPQWFHGLRDPAFGPDTSSSIFPLPHIVALYAVFFFFGVFYFDCNDEKGRLGRFWWLTLPVALLVVYPIGMAATFEPDSSSLTRNIADEWIRPLAVTMQALFAWLMIFGLMGLFRKICSQESRRLRYVSDSSYWLYVAHLPLIFLAQYLVKPLDLPAFVKFGIVCVGVTAFLLLTYEFIIRYTWVGTLLNGKRTRRSQQM